MEDEGDKCVLVSFSYLNIKQLNIENKKYSM